MQPLRNRIATLLPHSSDLSFLKTLVAAEVAAASALSEADKSVFKSEVKAVILESKETLTLKERIFYFLLDALLAPHAQGSQPLLVHYLLNYHSQELLESSSLWKQVIPEVLQSSDNLKLVFSMTSDILGSFRAKFEVQSGNLSQLKQFLETKATAVNKSLQFLLEIFRQMEDEANLIPFISQLINDLKLTILGTVYTPQGHSLRLLKTDKVLDQQESKEEKNNTADNLEQTVLLLKTCFKALVRISYKTNLKDLVETATQFWEVLIISQNSTLTPKDKIIFLREINSLLQQQKKIVSSCEFWNLVKEGLLSQDVFVRKVGFSILRESLSKFDFSMAGKEAKLIEEIWAIIFDIYETLESFGSHLNKSVWPRIEVIFKFVRDHSAQQLDSFPHQLLRVHNWLGLLLKRCLSHTNERVCKFVTKALLQRQYVTTHIHPYLCHEFLTQLARPFLYVNDQSQTPTQKIGLLAFSFFSSYLQNECTGAFRNKALQDYLRGICKYVKFPAAFQHLLEVLPALQIQDSTFLTTELIESCFFLAIDDQIRNSVYGQRYKMNQNLLLSLVKYGKFQQISPLTIFRLLAQMPSAFFYKNYKTLDAIHKLLSRIKFIEQIQKLSLYFLEESDEEKMPKKLLQFQGFIRLLSLQAYYEKQSALQLAERCIIQFCLEFQKVERRSHYTSGVILLTTRKMAQLIATEIEFTLSNQLMNVAIKGLTGLSKQIEPRVREFISRCASEKGYLNGLYLSPDFQQIVSLVTSLFKCLSSSQFVPLLSSDSSPLQRRHMLFQQRVPPLCDTLNSLFISTYERLLEIIPSLSSAKPQPQFFGETSILLLIAKVPLLCFSESIRQQKQYLHLTPSKSTVRVQIPEYVFSFTPQLIKQLLLIKDVQMMKALKLQIESSSLEGADLMEYYKYFLHSKWDILEHGTHLCSFDKTDSFQPLRTVVAEFVQIQLHQISRAQTRQALLTLKQAYVPHILVAYHKQEQNKDDKVAGLSELVEAVWSNIVAEGRYFKYPWIEAFLEFTFAPQLLQVPCFRKNQRILSILMGELTEMSDKYWLILRGMANYFLPLWLRKPQLMEGMQEFVLYMAVSREIRPKDSEVLQTLTEMLLPEATKNTKLMKRIVYDSKFVENGAYVRVMTHYALTLILERIHASQQQFDHIQEIKQAIVNLVRLVVQQAHKNVFTKKTQMPFTDQHRRKIRCWQLLCTLAPYINKQIFPVDEENIESHFLYELQNKMQEILSMNFLNTVRNYMEIFVTKIMLNFPEIGVHTYLIPLLKSERLKPQLLCSVVLIAGNILLNLPSNSEREIKLRQEIFEGMMCHSLSNSAHIRCNAQFYCYEYAAGQGYFCKSKSFFLEKYSELLHYFHTNHECSRIRAKMRDIYKIMVKLIVEPGFEILLQTEVDEFGQVLMEPYIERARTAIAQEMREVRRMENPPKRREDYWKELTEIVLGEQQKSTPIEEEKSLNYQRKIMPWDEYEAEHDEAKRLHKLKKRNDLIVVASLIEKVANMGGLSRTCEIFNASALVLPNKSVVEEQLFRGISVSSEEWLPIYQVLQRDLRDYLALQKSQGYKLVGLEQTANSVMIEEFEFPEKCVLLLGREKDGIPIDLIQMLDGCVEIPQYGIVRSLNVHVSGAICIWEYTKQIEQKKKKN